VWPASIAPGYPGGEDYHGLLTLTDLTAEAFARTDEVKGWIAEAHAVATSERTRRRDGDHCHDPFDCGFAITATEQSAAEFPLDWLPRLAPLVAPVG